MTTSLVGSWAGARRRVLVVLQDEDAGVGGGGDGGGGGGEGLGGAARWSGIRRLIDDEDHQLPFIRSIQPLILIFRKRVQQEVKEASNFKDNVDNTLRS